MEVLPVLPQQLLEVCDVANNSSSSKRTRDELKKRTFKTPFPKGWEGDLDRLVDAIFDEAYLRDWTWDDLARFSGLNIATVWALGERITRFPRLLTVWKLAKAVQLRMNFIPKRPSKARDKRTAVDA